MKKNKKAAFPVKKVTLLVARTTSIFSIFIILLFLIGEGFNPLNMTTNELILSLFFPLMLLTGLVIAWKKELLGGIIAISGTVLFFIVHALISENSQDDWLPVIFFSLPAVLFIIYEFIEKK
jgi:hypothetical protein